MSNDLKPCPFCGEPANRMDDAYYCKWHTGDISKDKWNTRPVEDALRKQLETERRIVEQVKKTMNNICRDNERLYAEVSQLRQEGE